MDPKDVDAFLDPAALPGELETIVRVYQDAGVDAGPSGWEAALKILRVAADVAGCVLPIFGAVSAVYGLAKS
jgi:hypothetical protein